MKKLPELNENLVVGLVGLGYVGAPLAVTISEKTKYTVVGYDINERRVGELRKGVDSNGQLLEDRITSFLHRSLFTSATEELADCDVFIVTVPTPVDRFNIPDLVPLKEASKTIGRVLRERKKTEQAVVLFESTVFPGASRGICLKEIEETSGLRCGSDFRLGYSPERINPSIEQTHDVSCIVKVTSGCDEESRLWVDSFYRSFVSTTHSAASIEVAEASKILENTQRDVNIALINELSVLFHAMNIDTNDIIDASATKWNFIPFRPGLVGGHCISVDPYYLAYIAEYYGIHAAIVSAARRVNDNMVGWLARVIVKRHSEMRLTGRNVVILGATFKEDCPDTRNSQSLILAKIMKSYGFSVSVVDPLAALYPLDGGSEVVIESCGRPEGYDIIVGCVAHREFIEWPIESWKQLASSQESLFFDIKNIIPRSINPYRI